MPALLKALMAIIVLLSVTVSNAQDKNQVGELNAVFENYFQVKDALVKSNGKSSAVESAELLMAIKVPVANPLHNDNRPFLLPGTDVIPIA